MTYLETFFRFGLILSTLLIIVLLFVGVAKKEKIRSETALIRLRANWGLFKKIFYLSVAAMAIFILHIAIEFLEVWMGVVFHTAYPLETEALRVLFVTLLVGVTLLNLRLVFLMVGGEK